MFIDEKVLTAAEFWVIAQLPENAHRRLELMDGEIINMPPSRQINTTIAMLIGYWLNAFVIPRKLGYVSGADGGYTITESNAFQPDAAFISKARHQKLNGVEFPVAPDIAFEVISPSESSNDVEKKVRYYLAAGTSIVFTVYPDSRTVYRWVTSADGKVQGDALTENDVIDRGDALPGFSVPVRDIFPDETDPAQKDDEQTP